MATKVSDIILDARALLDSYTEDGVVIAQDELADFTASCVRFANMGQRELYKIGNMEKTLELSRLPVENKLGNRFNSEAFKGITIYLPDEKGIEDVNSYYIEANGTHNITIQELNNGVWSDLITNSATVNVMTQYKGNINKSQPDNKIRIKIDGLSYFIYKDAALFEYKFQDDASVPDYSMWVEQQMPEDFKATDSVVEEQPIKGYSTNVDYKFEKPNRFYFNYNFSGTVKIIYDPIPIPIVSEDQELEIDDVMAEALSFYIAAYISPYENQALTNTFLQKFEELKSNAIRIQDAPVAEESISDVYGGWGY